MALQSAHAQNADSKLYAEIGYTQLNVNITDGVDSLKFSPVAFSGVLGYQLMPNVALEGFLGLGADGGRVKYNGVKTSIKGQVKNALGVFVRPSFAVSDNLNLFARVGWVRSELELSTSSASLSLRDNDVAYGFGANFSLSKNSYVQASWMNYFKKDGFKADGFTVAYGHRF